MQNNMKDWEYRVIEAQGYFNEDRFFVRREKDGYPHLLKANKGIWYWPLF
jgi:hypothetical protein